MLPFQETLHHSAPERSLSIPFSGLWFSCPGCRNASWRVLARPGYSAEPFGEALAAFREKNSRPAIFFSFFRKNSIFYGVI